MVQLGVRSRLRGYDRPTLTAAAFAAVVVLAELSPAFPHKPAPKPGWWLLGVLVTAAAGLAAVVVHRCPGLRWLRYIPLLLFTVAVQLLRAADGDGSAGFAPLLILPVVWYALYGTRRSVLLAVACAAAVQFAPLVFVGAPQYPVTLWRGAVLWVIILSLTGLAAQRLVEAFRTNSAALEVSEAKFRTAFADAPNAVALIGATGPKHGVFLSVNGALASLLGRPEHEIVDHPVFEFTHPEDRVLTEQHLLAPPEHQVRRTLEKRYLHSTGRAIPVKITYSRFQAGPEDEPFVVAQIEDVGEHRQAQLEMLTALEQEKTTTARLRRLEQASYRLAYTVNHDVQEPVANIIDNVKQLIELTGRFLTADQINLLRDVQDETARLSVIVARLMGGPELEPDLAGPPAEPVDVEAVVQAALESVRPLALGRELVLQSDVRLAGAKVDGDAAKLDRALLSVLDNAVKFNSPGGAIDAQARVSRDSVVIDVTDTGIGVSPDDQDRIFERFYRTQEAARRSIPGAGLGLAIAKAIVEQHHGTIEVFSEPGTGSTFSMVLPLRR